MSGQGRGRGRGRGRANQPLVQKAPGASLIVQVTYIYISITLNYSRSII